MLELNEIELLSAISRTQCLVTSIIISEGRFCSPPQKKSLYLILFFLTAGTQAGEEMPVVSKTNIKEYKDSFSNEKFDFRNHPNITFFVYVSNFTWPIKIQVRSAFTSYKDGEISVVET